MLKRILVNLRLPILVIRENRGINVAANIAIPINRSRPNFLRRSAKSLSELLVKSCRLTNLALLARIHGSNIGLKIRPVVQEKALSGLSLKLFGVLISLGSLNDREIENLKPALGLAILSICSPVVNVLKLELVSPARNRGRKLIEVEPTKHFVTHQFRSSP